MVGAYCNTPLLPYWNTFPDEISCLDNPLTLLQSITVFDFKGKNADAKNNIACAKEFGKFVGSKAKEKNISAVVFDRSGFKYHGKIKALAEGMREEGIKL